MTGGGSLRILSCIDAEMIGQVKVLEVDDSVTRRRYCLLLLIDYDVPARVQSTPCSR